MQTLDYAYSDFGVVPAIEPPQSSGIASGMESGQTSQSNVPDVGRAWAPETNTGISRDLAPRLATING